MANPAPWSIKGVDKETREKMKKMAMAKGMTLADFLDDMLNTSAKMIDNKISDLSEKTDSMINEPEKIVSHNTVIKSIEHETSPIVLQENISISQPQSIDDKPLKHEVFNTLIQKIGGDTPVISKELSDSDINETIMRERHMRDFVRIHMTEMREILATNLEQRIDEKLSSFMDNIINNMLHVTDGKTGITIDINKFLKKDDLDEYLVKLENFIQQKIEDNITAEIHSYSQTTNNIVEVISDEISRIGNILENSYHDIEKVISNVPQQRDITQDLSTSALTELQEKFELLLQRAGQIEDVCIVLDHKISDIQNQNNSTHFVPPKDHIDQMQPLKEEIEKYFQLNLQHIDKAVSSIRKENTPQITKSLQKVSNRLVNLEKMICNISPSLEATHNEYDEEDELQNTILSDLSDRINTSQEMKQDDNFFTLTDNHNIPHQEELDSNLENFKKEADWDETYDEHSENLLDDMIPSDLMDIRSQEQKIMYQNMRNNITEKANIHNQIHHEMPDPMEHVNRIRKIISIGAVAFICIALLWLLVM